MADIIQIRRGTAAAWTSANPILAEGEFGVETDTLQFKIGNGTGAWSTLGYVTQGPTGPTGPQGIQGIQGPQGDTGTIAVGTVTTGAEGSNATVTNVGTNEAAIFNFSIPVGATGATGPQGIQGIKGDTGTAATIAVGSVATGAEGSNVTVTNSGTSGAAVFDFSIPVGATGATGPQGPQGVKGDTGDPATPDSITATQLAVTGNGTTAQYLRSDGDGTFTWATPTDTNTTYSAGSGLSLSGTTFNNTAPDLTVSLTGSGATTVSGSYPNFTISSTDTNTNTTYGAGNGISLSGTTFTVGAGNGLSQTSTGLQMSGSFSGNFTATGNITAYSDARLKSDVKDLDGSKVYEMRGVSYIKDGELSSGVIAQELQKVAPELVMEGEEYLSVAYGNLVGYLIEAVKDLKAEVEELKNGVTDKRADKS